MQRLYVIGYGNMDDYDILYMSEDLEAVICKLYVIIADESYTEPLLHLAVHVDGKAEKCIFFTQEDRDDLRDVEFDELYLCITKDNEFW